MDSQNRNDTVPQLCAPKPETWQPWVAECPDCGYICDGDTEDEAVSNYQAHYAEEHGPSAKRI